jgi:hypothetical protein
MIGCGVAHQHTVSFSEAGSCRFCSPAVIYTGLSQLRREIRWDLVLVLNSIVGAGIFDPSRVYALAVFASRVRPVCRITFLIIALRSAAASRTRGPYLYARKRSGLCRV